MASVNSDAHIPRRFESLKRDSATAWATLAAALLAASCAALAFVAVVRFFGGFPPPHSGLYLVPVFAVIYVIPALAASVVLGERDQLETGWATGVLTFLGASVLAAGVLSLVDWQPITFSAYTVLLYSPFFAATVAIGEAARSTASRTDSAGLVAIVGGVLWAASWLLSFG